jgi:cytochrome c oxidase subunit IV
MQIAMLLAVITGVEIVIIFIPVSSFVMYTTLAVLSLVKFLAVIFYFMHLRWDHLFCTILFFIGLILGGGTLIALLALFAEDRREGTPDDEARSGPTSVWVSDTG